VLLLDGQHEAVRCFAMVHVVDRHFCASLGKTKCNRRTDAGIAARDERALTFKVDIYDSPSCF
jgi:hypothetical protein